MTSFPRFEYTWTFGNTLTLAAMLIGGLGVYSDIASTLRVQEQAVIQYRETLTEFRTALAQNEARVRALELGAGRIDEKLLSINASLQRIEKALSDGAGP